MAGEKTAARAAVLRDVLAGKGSQPGQYSAKNPLWFQSNRNDPTYYDTMPYGRNSTPEERQRWAQDKANRMDFERRRALNIPEGSD